MSEMTPQLIEHMFKALENPNRKLTEWEENFIESVKTYYQKRGILTEKQFDTLEGIYAEKTE